MSIPAFPLVVTLYASTDTDKTRPGAGHFRKRPAERGQGGKSRLMTSIREATEADWPAIWALFRAVVAEGDVFAYDEETTEDTAQTLVRSAGDLPRRGGEWNDHRHLLRAAQPAGSRQSRGQRRLHGRAAGAAGGWPARLSAFDRNGPPGSASRRCSSTLSWPPIARRSMSGRRAVSRWWGRLPAAFRHKELGLVDVLVMYRVL